MCSEAQRKWMQCQNNIGYCGQVCCPNTQHTHAADPNGNDFLKARAGIKRSAKDTVEKMQKTITANIAGLQENVLVRLPNIETIGRDVTRNRPNNHPAVPDIDIYRT